MPLVACKLWKLQGIHSDCSQIISEAGSWLSERSQLFHLADPAPSADRLDHALAAAAEGGPAMPRDPPPAPAEGGPSAAAEREPPPVEQQLIHGSKSSHEPTVGMTSPPA